MTLQLATGFAGFSALQGGGLAQFTAPEDGEPSPAPMWTVC